ncbi:YT521-B-like domain-containing protein [Boletus coccyginus]|nr:YT521-B-like domain-containing protein [Boletus coccyginus]
MVVVVRMTRAISDCPCLSWGRRIVREVPKSEEDQPASMVVLSAGVHRHLEGREQEAGWGKTFKIEWLCTKRVQFHRTRHLRNPWNHGREIKVSRDGTELEPGVGQQLVEAWSTLVSEPAGSWVYRWLGRSCSHTA